MLRNRPVRAIAQIELPSCDGAEADEWGSAQSISCNQVRAAAQTEVNPPRRNEDELGAGARICGWLIEQVAAIVCEQGERPRVCELDTGFDAWD